MCPLRDAAALHNRIIYDYRNEYRRDGIQGRSLGQGASRHPSKHTHTDK